MALGSGKEHYPGRPTDDLWSTWLSGVYYFSWKFYSTIEEMTIRDATEAEIADWNTHILSNPDKGNVFQGYEFAEQKRLGGWTPHYVVAETLAITILEKSIPLLGKLWYIPKGPGLTDIKQLDMLLPSLRKFAARQGVFLLKLEPELSASDETAADLLKLGLVKARPIQPNFSTVTVDISPSLDDILASLNQKGRHAIRRAERDGVTAKPVESSDENCRQMYTLLKATAAGSFSIRSYDYYRSFWQCYAQAGRGQMFFAYVDGTVVAGAYGLIFGDKSTYKDGASVRERPAYGASHLLQWRVIEWAKKQGATVHDLCGTPPSNEINNPDHPHYGLGRFKTSFNKTVTDYIGVWDVPLSDYRYRLWTKFGERLVLRLHRQFHHENWY